MRFFALCVAALAAVAATAEPAGACSCVRQDPRTSLAHSDAAFVGTLLERRERPGPIRSSADPVTLVFKVERSVKGNLPATVEVTTAAHGASCGIEAEVGQRIGLFLRRERGAWTSSLCSQIAPEQLLAAARPLPRPNGKGPVALLVGGRFGHARTLALDARGRTLGYGAGAGETILLAPCPGARHVAELATREGSGTVYRVGVRDLRTLRLVRERTLRLGGQVVPSELGCADRAGSVIHVFAASGEPANAARLIRVGLRSTSVLWRGAALAARFRAGQAYMTAGPRGERAIAVSLASGRATLLARVPPYTGALVPSPDGRILAGVAHRGVRDAGRLPPRLVVVDGASRRVRTSSLGSLEVVGSVVWLDERRFAFFPYGPADEVRVCDRALNVRGRFRGWQGASVAVIGSRAYGVGWDDVLRTAALPRGPARMLRRLPSPVARTIVAVRGTVRVRSPR